VANKRLDQLASRVGKKYMTGFRTIIALCANWRHLARKPMIFGDYRYCSGFGINCCARNRGSERVGIEPDTARVVVADLWREWNVESETPLQLVADIAACSISNDGQQLRACLQQIKINTNGETRIPVCRNRKLANRFPAGETSPIEPHAVANASNRQRKRIGIGDVK
jgi:hypothetical protein